MQQVLCSQNPFERCNNLLLHEEFRKAARVLDSCDRKGHFPDSVQHYRIISELLQKNTAKAKKEWKRLKHRFPAYERLDYLRGLIAFSETNYARSIDEFSKSIRKNPTDRKAIYNRSLAYGMMDEYLAAIEDLSALLH